MWSLGGSGERKSVYWHPRSASISVTLSLSDYSSSDESETSYAARVDGFRRFRRALAEERKHSMASLPPAVSSTVRASTSVGCASGRPSHMTAYRMGNVPLGPSEPVTLSILRLALPSALGRARLAVELVLSDSLSSALQLLSDSSLSASLQLPLLGVCNRRAEMGAALSLRVPAEGSLRGAGKGGRGKGGGFRASIGDRFLPR